MSTMKIIMPHSESVGTEVGIITLLMTIVYACKPVQLFALESVAVSVKVYVPAVVGVPEMRPSLVIGDNPVGSDPAVMVNV